MKTPDDKFTLYGGSQTLTGALHIDERSIIIDTSPINPGDDDFVDLGPWEARKLANTLQAWADAIDPPNQGDPGE